MTYAYSLTESSEKEDRFHLLQKLNVPNGNIFQDEKGAVSSTLALSSNLIYRPAFENLLSILMPGDLVYVKNFDDLGTTHQEILHHWTSIIKEKRADIAVIDMPLVDTRWRKEVVGSFVSDVVTTFFEYEIDKTNSQKEKQREGIERAREEGVRFGRKRLQLPEGYQSVFESYLRKELSVQEVCEKCGLARQTFFRRMAEYKKKRNEKMMTGVLEKD